MANVTMGAVAGAAPDAVDERAVHPVPNPFPLTLAGMLAALGPQAINFGISIGGGEAYLLPNVAARGTLHMHWLMLVSVVLETALVYECIKYSSCTGRSFFAATTELKPFGFWPWFWAVVAILTWAWPAWMGGAIIAAHRFTGIGNPPIWGLAAALHLGGHRAASGAGRLLLLGADLRLPREVLHGDHGRQHRAGPAHHGRSRQPEHYWQVLMGYSASRS